MFLTLLSSIIPARCRAWKATNKWEKQWFLQCFNNICSVLSQNIVFYNEIVTCFLICFLFFMFHRKKIFVLGKPQLPPTGQAPASQVHKLSTPASWAASRRPAGRSKHQLPACQPQPASQPFDNQIFFRWTRQKQKKHKTCNEFIVKYNVFIIFWSAFMLGIDQKKQN